jgi:hypothetical protein
MPATINPRAVTAIDKSSHWSSEVSAFHQSTPSHSAMTESIDDQFNQLNINDRFNTERAVIV